MISVMVVSLLSFTIAILYGVTLEEMGCSLDISIILTTSLSALSLTVMIFFGPLVHLYSRWDTSCIPVSDLKTLRNLVVCPIVEEFVFRSIMISILLKGGWSKEGAVGVTMASFGLAHLHHLFWNSAPAVLFQLCYTTVFGLYASFLFLRLEHLAAPIVAHIFCNYMGFPQLVFSRHKIFFGLCYLLGLILFSCSLFPLTEPPASVSHKLRQPF
eukprot:TRINITY_DN13708_c0_g1_i1.p1 TRINITY_DN13708_c0_g1~~TRINITY_DN13708_c0_g1_i1.p1  ORF type:complete len:214 (+),score=18.58 TRINITY_DN13708_c0_g1_i1:347-988(+)